jgi:hypothetical protein
MTYPYRMTAHCASTDACARDEDDAAQSSRDAGFGTIPAEPHLTVVA